MVGDDVLHAGTVGEGGVRCLEPGAVLAEQVAAPPRMALTLRNVATGRTRVVVVVTPVGGWLLGLVHRIEVRYFRHGQILLMMVFDPLYASGRRRDAPALTSR
jgi:hypothetical protein